MVEMGHLLIAMHLLETLATMTNEILGKGMGDDPLENHLAGIENVDVQGAGHETENTDIVIIEIGTVIGTANVTEIEIAKERGIATEIESVTENAIVSAIDQEVGTGIEKVDLPVVIDTKRVKKTNGRKVSVT